MEAKNRVKRILIGAAIAAAVSSGLLWATPPFGLTFNRVGPPTLLDSFSVNRHEQGWDVQLEANRELLVATQEVTFQPHGYSGWHMHPGPVFFTVKEGAFTIYEEDCSARVLMQGQGVVETGVHPHLVRNETDSEAKLVVTYLAPPSATMLRIDAPQPLTCNEP